jgi:hypothetical protein
MRPLLLVALLLGALGCEPMGPIPGGRLSGEVASGPDPDWSFTGAIETVKLETRPSDPYSVTTWVVDHDGSLYVPTRNPDSRRWVRYVTADPAVRIRVGDRIYERRAVRVTDAAELDAVADALIAKYQIERPAPDEPVALFRLDPRGARGTPHASP